MKVITVLQHQIETLKADKGYKGRTHLVSPATAAASAIAGNFVDVRSIVG
ncbi:MAG: hypothetical protein Ct9H300mP3_09590 [Gammaproteobacteria bacterium]|nr:MAG: hypothetical protein Ct9H300mP3_09590 [Gammaproteobacteria bacterium]